MKCVFRYVLVYLRISQVLHSVLKGGLITNPLSPLRLQVTVDDAGVRVRTWAWNEGADGTWTKDLGAPTTVLGEGADTVAVGSDTSIGTIAVMKAGPDGGAWGVLLDAEGKVLRSLYAGASGNVRLRGGRPSCISTSVLARRELIHQVLTACSKDSDPPVDSA